MFPQTHKDLRRTERDLPVLHCRTWAPDPLWVWYTYQTVAGAGEEGRGRYLSGGRGRRFTN